MKRGYDRKRGCGKLILRNFHTELRSPSHKHVCECEGEQSRFCVCSLIALLTSHDQTSHDCYSNCFFLLGGGVQKKSCVVDVLNHLHGAERYTTLPLYTITAPHPPHPSHLTDDNHTPHEVQPQNVPDTNLFFLDSKSPICRSLRRPQTR